ncbi:MAG: hypothetical protein JWP94_2509 [Mucilaginibacter sp.]|nr:hypothetical protein [Mucilaginibacter sp.]
MKNFFNLIILPALLSISFACKKPAQSIPRYTVSKVLKSDTLTTVNVHIDTRISAAELAEIAGKLKTDSAQIKNLEIHYLLPGNAEISTGDNSYYASARYVKENEIKPTDTLRDINGNTVRVRIFGLSTARVKHLLSLQPKEIANKNILGRYIDDYTHTVIIPFTDLLDEKRNLYVVELDSTAKIVSATMPLKITNGGNERWQVTQNGDYITLKDSVLAQYPAGGLGLPFNSIKSGI